MRPLADAVVLAWTLIGLAVVAVPALALLGVAILAPALWLRVLALLLAVGIGATAVIMPRLRYRHFRYGVLDDVLHVHSGVLVRSQAAVPLFRLQHIDLTQGPLDRLLELQRVVIHTASPAADVTLPGIQAGEAPELRTRLLQLARDAAATLDDGIADGV